MSKLPLPREINITELPTYDLTKIRLKFFDAENKICYFESEEIFKFDKVYGILNNRSRVTRINKSESTLIEQIISATIDAGYNGKLVWKVKLTKRGYALISDLEHGEDRQEIISLFKDCQQIHLFPFPSGNYYQGTNQTDLVPHIIFTYK